MPVPAAATPAARMAEPARAITAPSSTVESTTSVRVSNNAATMGTGNQLRQRKRTAPVRARRVRSAAHGGAMDGVVIGGP